MSIRQIGPDTSIMRHFSGTLTSAPLSTIRAIGCKDLLELGAAHRLAEADRAQQLVSAIKIVFERRQSAYTRPANGPE
jgi:hypothetical protein